MIAPALPFDSAALWANIQTWAQELDFDHVGVADVDLTDVEPAFARWLQAGFSGTLEYMSRHGTRRTRPAELIPGTISVITVRMNYLSRHAPDDWRTQERARLQRPEEGVISLYARGRDYHKVVRKHLQKLQTRIAERIGPFGHRVFSDSAPVLEKPLAKKSGIGWQGKHGIILTREAGSMFFLGEMYVDFHLDPTPRVDPRCGSCRACVDACPTGAIIAPGVVDARRCISYLTIEYHGSIAEELRPLMGNHIYGCDDCQTVCPWNKYAKRSGNPDFDEREGLTGGKLTEYFLWSEEEFLKRTEGGPIRRITHEMWLRNVAIALGNALATLPKGDPGRAPIVAALQARLDHPSALVQEHVAWALAR